MRPKYDNHSHPKFQTQPVVAHFHIAQKRKKKFLTQLKKLDVYL